MAGGPPRPAPPGGRPGVSSLGPRAGGRLRGHQPRAALAAASHEARASSLCRGGCEPRASCGWSVHRASLSAMRRCASTFPGRRRALRAMAACALAPALARLVPGDALAAPRCRGRPGCRTLADGWYRNPVLFADYSDPDAVRVGDDFFLISSSFQCTPGFANPALDRPPELDHRRPRSRAPAVTALRRPAAAATASGRPPCVSTTDGSGSTLETPTSGSS